MLSILFMFGLIPMIMSCSYLFGNSIFLVFIYF